MHGSTPHGESVKKHLIDEVKSVMLRHITEQVHLAIQMGNREDLTTHTVVEPVGSIGVNKAVARPLSGANALVDLAQQFESALHL